MGQMTVALSTPTAYSIRSSCLNGSSAPLEGDRYSSGMGSVVCQQLTQSEDAGSHVRSPRGIPGPFSEFDEAMNFASVQLTVLYGLGATQGNAHLPTGGRSNTADANTVITATVGSGGPPVTYRTGSTETFTNVSAGRWYDPALSCGFVYEAMDGTLFIEVINLPTGFVGSFSIWAEGEFLGHYSAGDFFAFEDLLGHAVTSFAVLGIVPETETGVVEDFPIQLGFNAEMGSFRQHALEASPVPEPAVAWMLTAGLFGVLGLARRSALTTRRQR